MELRCGLQTQMMGDEYRGWVWTCTFLGLEADEIHVSVTLVQLLWCAAKGDELVQNNYERFGSLGFTLHAEEQ
jgi:hypothetical protein